MPRPMTITEKIMAHAAGLPEVAPGQIIMAKIGLVYLSEIKVSTVLNNVRKLGLNQVFDQESVVILFDHCAVAPTINNANMHIEVRKLAKEFGLPIYDIGRHGLMHQVPVEEGYLVPGIIAFGTDAHGTTGGAVGAVTMGMATTDASVAAATGENWLRVPETVRIELQGKLPPGTMSRDIMFYFMGEKGWDGTEGVWAYQALEFAGEAARAMSIDSRMALCNLSADAGAKNAIFPPDEVTRNYMQGRARKTPIYHQSDADAVYADRITLDVSSLEPHVACPHTPDNVKPLSQLLGTKIQVATVSTCANGRLEDLHMAAEILKGRKVHPEVRMVVSPASQKIYGEALDDGTFSTLQKAGVVIGHASCGPCNGSQLVVLGDDEVCIGTVPRNFIGRLGSKKSYVYSANAAVVAASAIKGSIADPREFL